MTSISPAASSMTYEGFLRLEGRYQDVNGAAIAMPPVSGAHNRRSSPYCANGGSFPE